MSVPALALLTRTFRADVRHLRGHLQRAGAAVGVLIAVATIHAASGSLGAPGLMFFSALAWGTLVIESALGAFDFGSIITEEKDQGTLPLLRLTGISPASLLFGKSLSRLTVFALLIAVTSPYWWLAVTLGGVTTTQVAAAAVVLFTHLLLVSQIGTFWSVVARTTGAAVIASWLSIYLLMTLPMFATLPGVAARFPGWLFKTLDFARTLFAPSQMTAVLSPGYRGGIVSPQAPANVAIAAALFGLSWLFFDRFNRYELSPGVTRRRFWSFKRSAVASRRRPGRRPAEWGRAIYWKDYQQFAGGKKWMTARLVIAGIMLAAQIFLRLRESNGGPGFVVLAGELLAVEAAYLATILFQREFKNQTWDNLRILPLPLRTICGWKILGALTALIPAAVAFGAGALISLTGELPYLWREIDSDPLDALFWTLDVATFIVFLLESLNYFSLRSGPWLSLFINYILAGTVFAGPIVLMDLLFQVARSGRMFIPLAVGTAFNCVLIRVLNTRTLERLRGETTG
jgi:hypothetical protein